MRFSQYFLLAAPIRLYRSYFIAFIENVQDFISVIFQCLRKNFKKSREYF